MDGNLAATYTLIYSFLLKRSHTKAAQSLKKAAKDVVVLKDDLTLDGPQLEEIIKEWKASQAKPKEDDTSDSDSSSSSDSDSSEDSSDKESNSDVESSKKPVKGMQKDAKTAAALKQKAVASSASSSDSSSSDDSSSDSDSSDSESDSVKFKAKNSKVGSKNAVKPEPAISPKKDHKASSPTLTSGDSDAKDASEESSSDSDSDSDDDSSDSEEQSEDSSSDSSSSESDSNPKSQKKAAKKSKSQSKAESADKESRPKSKIQDEVKATKKRRTDEAGTAVTTATTETVEEMKPGPQSTGRIKAQPHKTARKTNARFQRIKADQIASDFLQDNRYEAKSGPNNDYGQKAHQDLIVTRGAGFRKEKNKKKKGSYRGGEISLQSHSFKFT